CARSPVICSGGVCYADWYFDLW
nr:immunoglobulin heavy chain junction region [Macaca mulatta]MOX37841.1 immunoglobulin heavy chain junction region [Macaca mulatta]MOX37965.1 immunoglobulin heavy chain junction region [Macaca mulatta]MOX38294.1 immunoglobulin heavy chain junction region [Macaca mulatta]MOX38916.1 immunoglobulin heavy chain junction region [Macaca mulatta]